MAKELQTEKVMNLTFEQKKILTAGVPGHSRNTAQGEFLQRRRPSYTSFCLFVCSLDIDVETSSYLLHC